MPCILPAWRDKVTLAAAGKEWMDSTPPEAKNSCRIYPATVRNFPEETCTFGDNLNDIAMLQKAGRSYAVANARAEVQAAAREVCPSYSEDGVLHRF